MNRELRREAPAGDPEGVRFWRELDAEYRAFSRSLGDFANLDHLPTTREAIIDQMVRVCWIEEASTRRFQVVRDRVPEGMEDLGELLTIQIGHEGKHYRLQRARIEELGGHFDPAEAIPEIRHLWEGYEEFPTVLESIAFMHGAVERFGGTIQEKLAWQALRAGDAASARLWLQQILPDETLHTNIFKLAMARYACDAETQRRCRAAFREGLRAVAAAVEAQRRSRRLFGT